MPTPMSPPGPLAPTRTVTFSSSGGATLYGEWFMPETPPRGLVVVLHGYAEHCGRYRELANVLHRAGTAVLTYDMRGHGQSTGQRGHIDTVSDYLDDLEAAMGQADALLGGAKLPRVLVGHSNGSLVTLRALTDDNRRPEVVGAVVSSPFLGLRLPMSRIKVAAALATSRMAPRLSMSNQLRIEDLTADAGKLAERRADTLCHGVATARWFAEARAAQQHVYDHAPNVSVPTLWLVSGADAIADSGRSREVADRLRAPVAYHDFAGLKHEAFNETERGRVFSTLDQWVRERLT
jgi:alpha-beta hydrolase superfamily lysophospholipase